MPTVTTRTLPAGVFVALALLSGSLAAFPSVATAELPQHIPIQGFGPASADFAESTSIDAKFGRAVAIRNGIAFAGIPSAQLFTGRVAVFAETATGWQRTATLAAPVPAADRHFGRTITFRDGVVVIGSDQAAYVFRQGTSTFNYVQKLVPPAADAAIEFPMALRYEAGTLFASAYRGSALPSFVYLFELDSTRKFVRRGKLSVPTNELFGADLSMTSTTLVVGSPGGRSRLRQSELFHHGPGSAYVFQRDSTGLWRLQQRLLAPRSAGGFGSAVAIDRGMIIVGAPQEAIEGGDRGAPTLDNHIAGGAAHVFVPVAGRYVETLRLRPRPDERVQYLDFGHQIAMFGETVVIAAVQPYGAVDVVPGGFVLTYSRDGSNIIARGVAAGHSVAYSIGLFQHQVLIGSPGSERCERFDCSGLARIYDVTRVARLPLPLTYRLTHILTHVVDQPFESAVAITGLNDKGEVIGHFSPFRAPIPAFVWRDGTFETLSMPGRSLQPVAINDSSQIAALCPTVFGAPNHVCLRFNNQFSLLAIPNEFSSIVRDLSNSGHVLGVAADVNGKATRFVWHNGVFTSLDALPGFFDTVPNQMNDRGTIVVGHALATDEDGSLTMPVIWQNGTIMPLGVPPGSAGALALDVNDRGTVVVSPAHTWQAGKFTKLDPPDGQHLRLFARRLNNRGVVAGDGSSFRDGALSGLVATRWLDRHGTDLNWLISGADPLRPFVSADQAFFINDRNQILVGGSDSREPGSGFYLLSPVELEE